MKKLKQILLVSTLVLFTNLVSAQLKFGASFGVGGATQSELCNIYENTDLILAYQAGVLVKNEFNNWFAVKANPNYSQKGSSFDVTENGQSVTQNQKLSYLTIPVKAEFSTPVKTSKFFFATGPYMGILLDAKNETNNIEIKNKTSFKNTDFGLCFEWGITKPISKTDVIFSINYDMGFSEISEMDCDINNKALTFNVGLLF